MDEYSKLWNEFSKNLGKLNTEMGAKIRKFLKIGFLQYLRSLKEQPCLSKKPYGENT